MINSSFSRLRPRFRLLLLAAVSAFPGTVLAQTETDSKHHAHPARPAPAARPVVRQPAAPHMNNRAAAKEQPDTLESITVSAERRQQSTHDVANSVTVLSGKFLQKSMRSLIATISRKFRGQRSTSPCPACRLSLSAVLPPPLALIRGKALPAIF